MTTFHRTRKSIAQFERGKIKFTAISECREDYGTRKKKSEEDMYHAVQVSLEII